MRICGTVCYSLPMEDPNVIESTGNGGWIDDQGKWQTEPLLTDAQRVGKPDFEFGEFQLLSRDDIKANYPRDAGAFHLLSASAGSLAYRCVTGHSWVPPIGYAVKVQLTVSFVPDGSMSQCSP